MSFVRISDYQYELPDERIAFFPMAKRDDSKLLVYAKGKITHSRFFNITDFLPGQSFLFFNDTKVIPARILFKKETGADIEIFLLAPVEPSPVMAIAMASGGECEWKCAVGNSKRWKDGTVLKKGINGGSLLATWKDRNEGIIHFTWSGGRTFAEVIQESGRTPLPPYIKRDPDATDRERYQTIYSHYEGAVAAPTAGLHFTPLTFQALQSKKIEHDFVTLHVSAGTFQPMKTETADDHIMHDEQIIITEKNIENLLEHDFIIPVGTTSMRTLESVYWYGVKLDNDPSAEFVIGQNDPYQTRNNLPDRRQALLAVLTKMRTENEKMLIGKTSIFIKPGYPFKICKGLITNFHQPGSTLILLVAAFVGSDWRTIYDEALKQDYRFLSYGDSSLLIP